VDNGKRGKDLEKDREFMTRQRKQLLEAYCWTGGI
jgi:hypothetical protein